MNEILHFAQDDRIEYKKYFVILSEAKNPMLKNFH